MSSENSSSQIPKKQVLYRNEQAYEQRRQFSRAQIKRRREAITQANKKSLMKTLKNSPKPFHNMIYKVLNGIWIAVIAVGSFIAWLISFLLV